MTFSTGEDVNLVTKNLLVAEMDKLWLVDGIISLPITRVPPKALRKGLTVNTWRKKQHYRPGTFFVREGIQRG